VSAFQAINWIFEGNNPHLIPMMQPKFDSEINKKVQVLVTGAGKGIGFDLCEVFSALGCHVGAISRQSDLHFEGKNIHHIQADIADPNEVVKQIDNAFSRDDIQLRILIHNAGVLINKPFENLSFEEMTTMNSVNYLYPMYLTQCLLPWLRQSKQAHTLYIGSMGGFQGSLKYPGLTVYGSTKAGGAGFMESLASEYRGSDLYFNALSLGAVQTDMLKEAFPTLEESIDVRTMSKWIAQFALEGFRVVNGQNLPISLSNP
jgi:3-oxoacyl-[acyl-carrier protein] reductase